MQILITGASGSGTTTLARALSHRLGFGFIDADDYYWERTTPPYQQKRSHQERLRLLLAESANHESCVVFDHALGHGTGRLFRPDRVPLCPNRNPH